MTEAELLFTEILNCNRLSLFLNKGAPLEKGKSTLIASVLRRRIKGEPIQYVLGKTEFFGLEFKVNPDVFIPRPETEILVEVVIRCVTKSPSHQVTSANILDLGTGSGCIAISLVKFIKNAKITAIEISDKALEVAKKNAELHNVNINFLQGDLFSAYNLTPNTYDLIVSNPPYIATGVIDDLQPELRYEPAITLDGGKDGLDFYRRIIAYAPDYLKRGGFLIMEMGFKQKEVIKKVFQKSGDFEIIEVVRDYNNVERVIIAKKSQISNSKSQTSSNDQNPNDQNKLLV